MSIIWFEAIPLLSLVQISGRGTGTPFLASPPVSIDLCFSFFLILEKDTLCELSLWDSSNFSCVLWILNTASLLTPRHPRHMSSSSSRWESASHWSGHRYEKHPARTSWLPCGWQLTNSTPRPRPQPVGQRREAAAPLPLRAPSPTPVGSPHVHCSFKKLPETVWRGPWKLKRVG